MTAPLVIALHGLGLSGRLFDPVRERLGADLPFDAPDLPGFGEHRESDGALDATVEAVSRRIIALAPQEWILVGHSRGGRIAARLAALAESGALPGRLRGMLLLAASPPDPEPMGDDHRRQMLRACDGSAIDEDFAMEFLHDNTGSRLAGPYAQLVLDDVQRSCPRAWRRWLEVDSKVDDSDRVGRLGTPAIVVAGGADGDLGPAGQREHTLPALLDARLDVLDGAGHLLPLERPDEVTERIRELVALAA